LKHLKLVSATRLRFGDTVLEGFKRCRKNLQKDLFLSGIFRPALALKSRCRARVEPDALSLRHGGQKHGWKMRSVAHVAPRSWRP